MRIDLENVITVHDVSKSIREDLEDKLTFRNPSYYKKERMGLWLGNTPEYIRLYELHGKDIIVPYGMFEYFYKGVFNHPRGYISSECKEISLYDYQKKAVDEVVNHQCGILQSKAGSGKTRMALAIIQRLRLKTLWITHTKDLLNQSYRSASEFYSKDDLGKISDGKVAIGSWITFSTVQTLSKQDLYRYRDIWDMIIVDECHRVCKSDTSVGMFEKVLNNLNACRKYGLSATVHRSDGLIRATKALIGNVVYEVDEKEIADKIMQVGIVPVPTKFKINKSCLDVDGTIIYQNLINALAEDGERNRLIVSLVEDRPTLILSSRVNHLETLKELIPSDLKTQTVIVTGKTKKNLREQNLDDLRQGRKQILLSTYQLAKEGLDIPRLDTLIMATPESDYAIVVQSIGRIARISEQKASPVCYDIVDSNVDFLMRKYKKRVRHYKKENCIYKKSR